MQSTFVLVGPRYRYRQEGAAQWIPVDVEPPFNTRTEIHNLQPGTTYEFQVIGKNVLGDGMFSNIVKERTKGNSLHPFRLPHQPAVTVDSIVSKCRPTAQQ